MYPVPKTLFLKISIILVKGFNIIIHLYFSGTIEIDIQLGKHTLKVEQQNLSKS